MTTTAERRIGILAEDETDCATVAVLVRRILGEGTGIRRRGRGGCSQLMRKAGVWMAELAEDGCMALVFVHDLDRENQVLKDEKALRATIERVRPPPAIPRHICIPVEELEAWFWSDPAVLEQVAKGIGGKRASPSPHHVIKPKEKLWHLSAEARGRSRYTTQAE